MGLNVCCAMEKDIQTFNSIFFCSAHIRSLRNQATPEWSKWPFKDSHAIANIRWIVKIERKKKLTNIEAKEEKIGGIAPVFRLC